MDFLKDYKALIGVLGIALVIFAMWNTSKSDEPQKQTLVATANPSNEQSEISTRHAQIEADRREQLRVQDSIKHEQELERYIYAINTVLREDNEIGLRYNRQDPIQISAGMREIDLSHCPRDFAVAYVAHIQAWEKSAQIYGALKKLNSEDSYIDVLKTQAWQSILGINASAIRDAVDADRLLREALVRASNDVHNTYNQVELIATSYGATLVKH